MQISKTPPYCLSKEAFYLPFKKPLSFFMHNYLAMLKSPNLSLKNGFTPIVAINGIVMVSLVVAGI